MASPGLIFLLAGLVAIIITGLLKRVGAVEPQRGVRFLPLNPSTENPPKTDTGIDIIAIHGLDTESPKTWEYKEGKHKINWLADQHMLPAEEPAVSQLQGILESDTKRGRPIPFIASCLGGVILMKALVEAKGEYAAIREATRGIVFLATTCRGTSFQDIARWAQPRLKAWASILGQQVTNLLDWVNSPTFDLTHLVREFTKLHNDQDRRAFKIHTFYEKRSTSPSRKAPWLSWLLPRSEKLLVDEASATLDCVPNPLPLDRAHVLMNKFSESHPDYKTFADTIQRLLAKIQTGTPLAQADTWIREKNYDKQTLKVKRLSGDCLEMDGCYTKLAFVETQKRDIPQDAMLRASPFSLTERPKLDTPHKSLRVELLNLFQPRTMPDGSMWKPRRILVRGRAGVGKPTLCKKIVHGFVHEGMWRDLFERVVWVQLRDLKGLSNNEYNLGGLLEHILFRQKWNSRSLSDEM